MHTSARATGPTLETRCPLAHYLIQQLFGFGYIHTTIYPAWPITPWMHDWTSKLNLLWKNWSKIILIKSNMPFAKPPTASCLKGERTLVFLVDNRIKVIQNRHKCHLDRGFWIVMRTRVAAKRGALPPLRIPLAIVS